jgi:DNA-binding MarR family transcriptional regulator
MNSPIVQMVSCLGMIDRGFERYVTSAVHSYGYPDMTRICFSILSTLQMTRKPNQRAISELTGITPQAIHRHMKFLESHEYIKRTMKHKDARSQNIYITKKGKKILCESFTIAKISMQEFFKNLTLNEVKTITRLLKKIK